MSVSHIVYKRTEADCSLSPCTNWSSKTLELVSNVEGVYESGMRPSNTMLQAFGRPKTEGEPRSKNAKTELILSAVIMVNTVGLGRQR